MTESFAQRVERLKDNEKHVIFKDMPKEDQTCLKKVGAENCQYLTTVLNANLAWYNGHKGDDFVLVCIYRIRHDYQPKPEYIDLRIEKVFEWLGIARIEATESFLPYPFTHLHCLPSLPGFVGFYLTETSEKDNDYYIGFDSVAKYLREGKAVVARFQKE